MEVLTMASEIEGKRARIRWYFTPITIIIAILVVGPFALPLVWKSPALARWQKIVITLILIAVTVWLVKVTVDVFRALAAQMETLKGI